MVGNGKGPVTHGIPRGHNHAGEGNELRLHVLAERQQVYVIGDALVIEDHQYVVHIHADSQGDFGKLL